MNQVFSGNMLILRSLKHFVGATFWPMVVSILLRLIPASSALDVDVVRRNLDQPAHPLELDLLARIGTNNNGSGMVVPADQASRSNVSLDDYRPFQSNATTLRTFQGLLINSTEVTLLTTVNQYPSINTDSTIHLDVDSVRMVEISSRALTSEINITVHTDDKSYTQHLPHQFDDGSSLKYAITLEANRIVIHINCRARFEFPAPLDGRGMNRWKNASFAVTQNNNGSSVQEAVGEFEIKAGPDAYLSQCRNLEKSTPPQRGFVPVELLRVQVERIDRLEKAVRLLTNKVYEEETKRTDWEKNAMSCQRPDGTIARHNETWENNCRSCSCIKGGISCEEIFCPIFKCNGTKKFVKGTCCPVCEAESCNFMGHFVPHNESRLITTPRVCISCYCFNGHETCQPATQPKCPELSCPESEQVRGDSCCPECVKKPKMCGKDGECHEEAYCKSEKDRDDHCVCRTGFSGNGTYCADVDECDAKLPVGQRAACRGNAVCTNLHGSFNCDCPAGYEQINPWSCRDVDECRNGTDRCHENAKCYNTEGSYNCQCQEGYEGDGFNCSPICEPACENDGICIAPNTCACSGGFFGPECQTYTSARLVSPASKAIPVASIFLAAIFVNVLLALDR